MDYFDLSVEGRWKLARWISKRYRTLCISELVRNSKDEEQLFAMCEYIDSWYDEHEGPVTSKEASVASQTVHEVSAPTTVQEVKYVVPEKHTRLRQHNFSRRVSSRLNVFITQNPEVCISKILSEAATEDDLIKIIDDIESIKMVDDKDIKMWTVRPSRRL